MLLTGLGVGLTLPTLIGSAAAALPPTRFATGSAITTMARQVGAVVGVALTVSLIGTPHGPQATLNGFRHGWTAVIAAALLGLPGLPGARRRPAPSSGEVAADPEAGDGVPGGRHSASSRTDSSRISTLRIFPVTVIGNASTRCT